MLTLPRCKREQIVVAAVLNDVAGNWSSPVAPVAAGAEDVLALRGVRPKFISQNEVLLLYHLNCSQAEIWGGRA